MTELENALKAACRAFLNHYALATEETPQTPSKNAVRTQKVETSNGIPKCPRHDRIMRPGEYGYYCTAKEEEPEFANKKGYCNYRA